MLPKLNLILFLTGSLPLFAELKWAETVVEQTASVFNEAIAAEFSFENVGDEPVYISQLNTSCGCTTAKLNKSIYKPGECGKVVTSLDIGSRQGLQVTTVKVSVDYQDEPIVLTMKTLIPKVLEISRTFVFWEQSNEPSIYEIDLKVDLESPVRVLSAVSDNNLIDAQLELVEEGKHYKLLVYPVSLDAPVKARIAIQTDFPTEKPRTYYVYAHIK